MIQIEITVTHRQSIVGFYWTRSVPWRGHYDLPRDAREASKISRTIRYQRLLTKFYARQTGSSLVEEVTWLDPEDRASKRPRDIADALQRVFHLCVRDTGDAALVYVDFSAIGRRPHPALVATIQNKSLEAHALHPVMVRMRGACFCPAEHFRSWANRKEKRNKQLKSELNPAFWSVYDGLGPGLRSDRAVAEKLNATGVLPARKSSWNAEMVRTMRRRHPLNAASTQGRNSNPRANSAEE